MVLVCLPPVYLFSVDVEIVIVFGPTSAGAEPVMAGLLVDCQFAKIAKLVMIRPWLRRLRRRLANTYLRSNLILRSFALVFDGLVCGAVTRPGKQAEAD